jgi:hypothetical protein
VVNVGASGELTREVPHPLAPGKSLIGNGLFERKMVPATLDGEGSVLARGRLSRCLKTEYVRK